MNTIQYSCCPLDCPDTCGLEVEIADDRLVGIRGAKNHPYTNGFICAKMRGYVSRFYDENRILYPMRRTGKKGEGTFKRISWDDAWDILVSRLTAIKNTHGSEALLPFMYAGNMGFVNRFGGHPFFHRYGASTLLETICSKTAGAGWQSHCGSYPGAEPSFAAQAKLIIAWGIDVRVTNVHFWQYIAQARKNGAKLIVIDPYENETAAKSDQHVKIRPGGDGALALGAIKYGLEKGLIDHQVVGQNTTGFALFSEQVRELSWDDIGGQTGLDRHTIAELAEQLFSRSDLFIRVGMGLTRNSRGGMAIRSITALAAVLQLFDYRPGRGILLSSNSFSIDSTILTGEAMAARPTRKINMLQLGQALNNREKPVHGLFVYNANPLTVAPDSNMVRQGLLRDDLFTVVHEQVMTPTARYADLLLPATTFLENSDIYKGYGHFYLGVVPAVLKPQGEALSNFDLFQNLARKMGYTEPLFKESLEARMLRIFSSFKGAATPADRLPQPGEWIRSRYQHPESTLKFPFIVADDDDLPKMATVISSVEFDIESEEYPLLLLTPPDSNLLNSTFGERFQEVDGSVLVHPQDAARFKLVGGQQVQLKNQRGEAVRTVTISERTQPGLVVAQGLYWENKENGSGINNLTSQRLSDMGGGSLFHETRITLTPLNAQATG